MSDVDITKYPEGVSEIIKYLDFLPDDDAVRTQYLLGFAFIAILEAG